MENCEEKYDKLKDDYEVLRERVIDLTFELDNTKFYELLEFVRNLKESIDRELKDVEDGYSKLTKEDILNNLRKYIEDFAEYTRLDI